MGTNDLYFIVHTILDILLLALQLLIPAMLVNHPQRWVKDIVAERFQDVPLGGAPPQQLIDAEMGDMGAETAPGGRVRANGGSQRQRGGGGGAAVVSVAPYPLQLVALLEYLEDSDARLRWGGARGVVLDVTTLTKLMSTVFTVLVLVWQNSSGATGNGI